MTTYLKKKFNSVIFGRFKRKNPRAVRSNRRILDRNVVVSAITPLTQYHAWGSCSRAILKFTIHNRLHDHSVRGILQVLPCLHPCKQRNPHRDP